jgi:CheY-like chemotaxis protein
MFLEDLGYTVLVAKDPEKALALAAQHPGEIHLLITDVIMPGMSGRDLAQRLSELRPAIKRLFISGFTADVIAQRGILDDGVNLLSKPFGRDALARKVREVLEAGERTRTQ